MPRVDYTTHIQCPNCGNRRVAKGRRYVWCMVANCGWVRPIDSTHLAQKTNE